MPFFLVLVLALHVVRGRIDFTSAVVQNRTMSIVIVEDETRVLNFLAEALRKEGYIIHACETYEAALESIKALNKEIEILVLDRLLGRQDAISLIPVAKREA